MNPVVVTGRTVFLGRCVPIIGRKGRAAVGETLGSKGGELGGPLVSHGANKDRARFRHDR